MLQKSLKFMWLHSVLCSMTLLFSLVSNEQSKQIIQVGFKVGPPKKEVRQENSTSFG